MTGVVGPTCPACHGVAHNVLTLPQCVGDTTVEERLARDKEAQLHSAVVPSLLVTTGLVPVPLAAQALVS